MQGGTGVTAGGLGQLEPTDDCKGLQNHLAVLCDLTAPALVGDQLACEADAREERGRVGDDAEVLEGPGPAFVELGRPGGCCYTELWYGKSR